MAQFPDFNSCVTDADGRTDIPTCRDARTHLKTENAMVQIKWDRNNRVLLLSLRHREAGSGNRTSEGRFFPSRVGLEDGVKAPHTSCRTLAFGPSLAVVIVRPREVREPFFLSGRLVPRSRLHVLSSSVTGHFATLPNE